MIRAGFRSTGSGAQEHAEGVRLARGMSERLEGASESAGEGVACGFSLVSGFVDDESIVEIELTVIL